MATEETKNNKLNDLQAFFHPNFPMMLLPFKWILGSDCLQDSHLGVPLPIPTSNGNEEEEVHCSRWERQATTWSGAEGICVSGLD